MEVAMIVTGIMTVLAACGVVLSKKALSSALSLVLTLFLVAVHFALLNAHFVAAVQVMVYAGAIMVLVVFVIMLIGPDAEVKEGRARFASFVAASLVGVFISLLWLIIKDGVTIPLNAVKGEVPLVDGSTAAIGETLFVKYLFPFEVTSLLILAAIIGAVVLGFEPKRALQPGRGLRAKQGVK